MMLSLVGSTGFVGSNILKNGAFDNAYHSSDINTAYGTNPDLLVYAGVRAEKFLANKYPQKDFGAIQEAIANVKKINPKKIVLISTIDVYAAPDGVDENVVPDKEGLLPYGLNRLYFEEWVKQNCDDYLIVRLPGLFGMNIKKNFIYDFIHYIPALLKKEKYEELAAASDVISNSYEVQEDGFYRYVNDEKNEIFLRNEFARLGFSALNFTDSRGIFQFYNLDKLWKDIETALANGIPILNIATEPISIGELYQYLTGRKFCNEFAADVPMYNFKSIHFNLYNGKDGYLYSKQDILKDIKLFVEAYKNDVYRNCRSS